MTKTAIHHHEIKDSWNTLYLSSIKRFFKHLIDQNFPNPIHFLQSQESNLVLFPTKFSVTESGNCSRLADCLLSSRARQFNLLLTERISTYYKFKGLEENFSRVWTVFTLLFFFFFYSLSIPKQPYSGLSKYFEAEK